MENLTIAFIGSGNIASSMIGGLIANGIKPEKLIAADADKTQQQLISEKYGIKVFNVNYDAAKHADVIIFAVKPQVMPKVVKEKIVSFDKAEDPFYIKCDFCPTSPPTTIITFS